MIDMFNTKVRIKVVEDLNVPLIQLNKIVSDLIIKYGEDPVVQIKDNCIWIHVSPKPIEFLYCKSRSII